MPTLYVLKQYYIMDLEGHYYRSNSQNQLAMVKSKNLAQRLSFSDALYKIKKSNNHELILKEETIFKEIQNGTPKKNTSKINKVDPTIIREKELIIKTGIMDEMNLERYLELFKTISIDVLRELYINNHTVSRLFNAELYFERDQDRWIIRMIKTGVVELWHNNYIKNMAGERYCLDYYHKECECQLEEAMKMIARYDYSKHVKK